MQDNLVNNSQKTEKPEIEELMKDQGGLGKFNIFVFVVIEMQIVAGNIIGYGLSYLTLYPQLFCQTSTDGKFVQCTQEEACAMNPDTSSYEYNWSDQHSLHNFITSFNLLCATSFEIGFFGMSYFIGVTIMSIITPYMQDKYGRFRVFTLCSFSNLVLLICFISIPNSSGPHSAQQYILYLLFFLLGAELPGRMLTGYVYFQEFIPKNYQNLIGTFEGVSQGAIFIYLTLYYKYGNFGWKWPLVFAAMLNLFALILTFVFIPESPKWLYEKERYIESYKVFKKMAAINGKKHNTPVIDSLLISYQPRYNPQDENQNNTLGSMFVDRKSQEDQDQDQVQDQATMTMDLHGDEKAFDVWQELQSNPDMLINMIIMTMVWLSGSFNSYLISYQLKYLKGDIYINTLVSSASDTTANITSAIFIYFIGLKNALVISFIIGAAGMLCLIYVDTESQSLLSLFILGSKYGVSQVFNMAYLGNVMLFPTTLVATSFGICNLFARLGTIFAPFVAELKPIISKWVFTSLMLVSMVVVLGLRTKKRAK